MSYFPTPEALQSYTLKVMPSLVVVMGPTHNVTVS